MNLDALFEQISGLRVGVLGDYFLDMYRQADMRLSQLSRETPHHTLPIVQERVSLGGEGCHLAEKDVLTWVPGRKVPPPVDPVGAGDAFHAALALALAAKLPLRDAADFADTVASVTVAKTGTTGTASPGEVSAKRQGENRG